MKINSKQAKVELFFLERIFTVLLVVVLLIGLSSSVSYAPTKISPNPKKMTDAELADIDAQAFFKIEHFASTDLFWTTPTVISQSDIPGTTHYTGGWWSADTGNYNVYQRYNTGSENVIRISLDMEVQAHGFIEAQRHGYRYGWQGDSDLLGNETGQNQWGWDVDFPNMWLGDRSSDGTGAPLRLDGIIIDLGFDNFANATTRKLNYIELGSQHTTGNVTQTLDRINGLTMDGGTGTNNGVLLRQTASGTRVAQFNNEVFTFIFSTKYHWVSHNGTNYRDPLTGFFIKLDSYHTDNDLHRPGDAGGW